MHQFELGCIKLHTPYRYKVHPKLYFDWSMCTVFYRVEFLNTFQHRVESSVVFRSSFNIVAWGTHRRKKVDEKSCVTPAGTSNELDVQNEWEENTHTH